MEMIDQSSIRNIKEVKRILKKKKKKQFATLNGLLEYLDEINDFLKKRVTKIDSVRDRQPTKVAVKFE